MFATLLAASAAMGHLLADQRTAAGPEGGRTRPADGGRQTGSIAGSVVYRADPKRPWRYARYYVKNRKRGELAEAVVALKPSAAARRPSRKVATVVVDQKDFQFTPETIAVRAGDRVKFLNSDKVLHNVRTTHPRHSFNVNTPSGDAHIETFAKAGGMRLPYRIGCVFHSAMRSWIFVFDHPHFQVTKTDGRFHLKDIPPGEYILQIAHPAGQLRSSRSLRVEAGVTTRLDLTVSPDDRPPKRP